MARQGRPTPDAVVTVIRSYTCSATDAPLGQCATVWSRDGLDLTTIRFWSNPCSGRLDRPVSFAAVTEPILARFYGGS